MKGAWPLLFLLAAGCAQVRDPQGGPTDTSAPALVEALPPSGTINFHDKRIILRFDERVKLERVRERLLISPPLEPPPDVVLGRSDEVHILLRSPLAPNTTYVFNIGEAVVDLSEGNIAAGTHYVLSTGAHIDSASIGGTVIDAFTGAAANNILVLAHTAGDTSDLVHGRPGFFTRSDSAGRFRITHMCEGNYHISALRDKNANYRYDLPNEDIAFADSTIIAGGGPVALAMFRERPSAQQVLEAKVLPERSWRLVMAKPSPALVLRQLDRVDDALTWYAEWSAERDTALLWPSDTTLLAGQRFSVNEQGTVLDTILYRPQDKMPFHLPVRLGDEVMGPMLYASRPLSAFDSTRAFWLVDSIRSTLSGGVDTSDRRRFRMDPTPNKATSVLLLPGAFTDIYGGRNDTLQFSLVEKTLPPTGTLNVMLHPDSSAPAAVGPWALHVLDMQGSLLRRTTLTALPAKVDWSGLPAGNLVLKLIVDNDGDGRWSTGSLIDDRQPERVQVYPQRIDLRAGWELEVDWVVQP